MTRLELQNLVLQWVDDPQGTYFSPPDFIQPALNRAQQEVQKQLIEAGENYYLKPPLETTTVVNQAEYILPDDFLKLHRLIYVIGGVYPNETTASLGWITLQQQDLIGPQVGTPTAYIMKKNRIQLVPAPDRATTLRLFYSYRVSNMVGDSSTPDAPEEFHEYIAILAAMDCFIKDDRVPSNIMEKKKYYETLLKQMAEDRTIDHSRMVVITEDEGYLMPF